MEKDFSCLIGVPYVKRNCWELVRDFYKIVYDVELKHYCDSIPDSRDDIKSMIYSNVGDFEKVDKPLFGDLIIVMIRGIESHIAVYLGNGKMLHSSKTTGSVIDRVAKWERTISGYYRHRKSAS